jgi:hypothetical protein
MRQVGAEPTNEVHGDALRKRYVAVKRPDRWYKTINKV